MRPIDSALEAHLAQEATTLCRCWIIECTDGSKLGFTEHDEQLEVQGVVCEQLGGMESSQIEDQLGFGVNSAEVSGAIVSGRVTAEDIRAGLYDQATIKTFLVNWQAPEKHVLDRVHLVSKITQTDSHFSFELKGLASIADRTQGRHFVSRCQASLGDSNCGIDLSNPQYLASGTVTKIHSASILEVYGLDGFDGGWFRAGHLVWSGGENSGKRTSLLDHIYANGTTTLHLWQAMPAKVMIGDSFSVTAGCNKGFDTCKTKFHNQLNFRGFPHIPGNRHALKIAKENGQHDGAPLVK